MNNINTKQDIEAALNELGYVAEQKNEIVLLKLGNKDNPVIATLSIVDNDLVVTCKVLNGEDLDDDGEMAAVCLSLNYEISPYAFALVGDDENQDLVLTDSLLIGDLSLGELKNSVESLVNGLVLSKNILKEIKK